MVNYQISVLFLRAIIARLITRYVCCYYDWKVLPLNALNIYDWKVLPLSASNIYDWKVLPLSASNIYDWKEKMWMLMYAKQLHR